MTESVPKTLVSKLAQTSSMETSSIAPRTVTRKRVRRDDLPLEFGHLGRILARSPRFFRNVFSINTGLPDLASGPFCAEGVRPEGPRKQVPALAHARQLKRLNGSLKRRRRVGA